MGGKKPKTEIERIQREGCEKMKYICRYPEMHEEEVKEIIITLAKKQEEWEEAMKEGFYSKAEKIYFCRENKNEIGTERLRQILEAELLRQRRNLRRTREETRKQWREARQQRTEAGQKHSQWAGELWRNTKKRKKMGIGMKVLRNEEGEIKIEEETEPIVRKYMGKMWGTKEELPKETYTKPPTPPKTFQLC